MDDECVEELGKPISSLKVAELRDELTKRALIKTGNKKELIDRLRLAIQRQSTTTTTTVQLQQESAVDLTLPLSAQLPQQQQQDASDHEQSDQNIEVDQSSETLAVQDEAEELPLPQLNQELQQDSLTSSEDQAASKHEPIEHEEAAPPQQPAHSIVEEAASQLEPDEQVHSTQVQIKDFVEVSETKSTESDTSIQNTSLAMSSERGDQIDSAAETSQSTPSKIDSEVPAQAPITLKRRISDLKDANSNRGEKRRKWGGKVESSQSSESSNTNSGGISSQKLQELINLNQTEAAVSSKDSPKLADGDQPKGNDNPDEEQLDEQATKTQENPVQSETNSKGDDVSASEVPTEKPKETSSRKEKLIPQEEPERDPTNSLLVENLVRPFTVSQLKEMLTKFGPMIDDKFWTNKVKSKCCITYETIEVAQQTKAEISGQHWPSSNPKTLKVSFITEEDFSRHLESDVTKPTEAADNPTNGAAGDQQNSKSMSNRLGERVENAETSNTGPIKKRLGEKVASGEVNTKSSNVNRSGNNHQPQELDDLYRKTKCKPSLFWLPLTNEAAELRQKERRERETRIQSHKPTARRSPPPRRRSPKRRSPPPRHRSPVRRSSPRHRSPNYRGSPRRRSPSRDSPPRRLSAPRQSPPRRSPGPVRRPVGNPRRSPSPLRRPPGPIRRSPNRRSPGTMRRSPGPPMRRSPSPLRRMQATIRRSPIRRSPDLMRRSPSPLRRVPGTMRRSPIRRSPGPIRRSPGPIRRSPRPIRRSPGSIRRSPGPIRRSPGPIRRSPGPIRRSPGPIRRSPGPIRRSPGPIRRSPGPIRRSPGPIRRR